MSAELLVELLGGAHGVLAGHGVGDEEDLLRREQALERLQLLHELLVDVQAAGGVHDDHVAAAVDGLAARFLGQALDRRGVGFAHLAFVEVRLHRLGDDLQLLARRRAVDVHAHQQRTAAALLQPGRELARGGGLAGALQAGHQNDGGRLRGEPELGSVFAQERDQLVAHDLDDLLGGGE